MCCTVSGYSPFQAEAAKRNLAQCKIDKKAFKNYSLVETGSQMGKIKEVALVLGEKKDIHALKKTIAKKWSAPKKSPTPLMKESLKQYQLYQQKKLQNPR